MFEVSVTGSFEAAHAIDAKGAPDAYRHIHGHSYFVTASVAAETPGPDGWVVDLGALDAALKDVLLELDHSLLNEKPGLAQPTFENILLWVDGKLRAKGYVPSRLEIERPTVRQRATYIPRR